MPWIRTTHKPPKDLQCVYVVFEHELGSTAVWYAQYRDGRWFGYAFDSEGEQELNGEAICWQPEPENPFDNGA